MAHFSQLNDSNVVIACNVIADSDCLDGDGNESEAVGVAFCEALWGGVGTWKQTSFNSRIRKNFGVLGTTYDATRDAFLEPKPFPTWVLDDTTCKWKAPVDMLVNDRVYFWNESAQTWDDITVE
tara:strand:+ start:68 stop:439 length:372 start_codon:yes stop_codon:yes gene_type:complete